MHGRSRAPNQTISEYSNKMNECSSFTVVLKSLVMEQWCSVEEQEMLPFYFPLREPGLPAVH